VLDFPVELIALIAHRNPARTETEQPSLVA
jgi:hypothetical protein